MEDRALPSVGCNNPLVVLPPPFKPMPFKATAIDNCGIAKLQITHFECYKYDKFGKRVDRTRTCGASVSGDTITLARPMDLPNDIGR